jgi:hypothetical protein
MASEAAVVVVAVAVAVAVVAVAAVAAAAVVAVDALLEQLVFFSVVAEVTEAAVGVYHQCWPAPES